MNIDRLRPVLAGPLPLVSTLALGIVSVSSAHAEVVINEVLFAADADHTLVELRHEFVELYNAGPGAEILSGWELRDGTALLFVFPEMTLPAGAYVTVYSGSADGDLSTDDDPADGSARLIGTDFWSASDLSNAGDAVQLHDAALPLPRIRDFIYFDSGNQGDPGVDDEAVAAGLWKDGAAIDTLSSSPSRGRSIALRVDGESPRETDPSTDAEDLDWFQYDATIGATPGAANADDTVHADGFE